VLDPLNVLFAPAKAAGVVGRGLLKVGVPEGASVVGQAWKHLPDAVQYENLANKAFESNMGRRWMQRAPDTEKYRWLNPLMDAVQRESDDVPIRMAVKQANEGLAARMAEAEAAGTPFTLRDVYSRAEGVGPDDLAAAAAREHVDPLKIKHEAKFDTRNQLLTNLDLPEHLMVNEDYVRHVPHRQRVHEIPEEGQRVWVGGQPRWQMPQHEAAKRIGDAPYSVNPYTQPHAEILSWRRMQDPDIGQLGMAPDVEVAVGKLADKRTGVKRLEDGRYIHKESGLEVFPVRASLDAVESVTPKGTMLTNPADAFGENLKWMDKQITMLRVIQGARDKGALVHYGGPDTLMDGFVPLRIPGFENFQTTPGVRNHLENLAKTHWDRNTPGLWDEELLNRALDTKAGRGLKFATGHAKRYMLLDPSWMIANTVSGVQQQGLNGVSLLGLLPRNIDALRVMKGKTDILDGITNQDFLSEMARRRVVGAEGLWGQGMREGREHGEISKMLIDKLTDKIGYGQGAGDIAQKGMAKFGGAVDKFFEAGSRLEDQGKLTVAINRFKEKYPNFANLNETDKVKALDDVANAAKKAMFDYGGLTPYERNLQQLIPFYNWTRNIAASTGKMALEKPQTLGKYGRGLDTVFEPMDREDKVIADDWVKQSGPIYGALGTRFGRDEEGRNLMGLLARYLPHGQLEQFVNRPKDTALGLLNPYLKALPEVLGNYNTFKGRPIDPLASFPGMFINPLIGGTHDLGRSKILGQDVPASVEYLHGFLPGGRQLRQLDTWGRGLGLWEDPNKGPIEPGDALAWSVTGGKAYPFDRDRALINRQREDRAREAAVRSRLRFASKKGDLSQYEYYMQLLQEDIMRRQELRRTRWGQDAV